jgi:hypothetical protein
LAVVGHRIGLLELMLPMLLGLLNNQDIGPTARIGEPANREL